MGIVVIVREMFFVTHHSHCQAEYGTSFKLTGILTIISVNEGAKAEVTLASILALLYPITL